MMPAFIPVLTSIPTLNGLMLAVGGSVAASIVAKVTVSTALGLIAAWMARRSRASVRHALLAASFAVLLILPIASIVAPPVVIAMRATPQSRTPAHTITTVAISAAAPVHSSANPAPSAPEQVPVATLLLIVWIAGTGLFLFPVALGLWQMRSVRRSALPWTHGQALAEKLADDAGIRRRVEVLLHESVPGPITCGLLRPAIVLPQDAQTWEDADLNRAMVHELEHVRRGDWLMQCLARTISAAYWFHPLVWIAWRKLQLEAERSCDDAVLGRSEAIAYADQLVAVARAMVTRQPLLAMANRADLGTRVSAVLDGRQQRGRAGKFAVAFACASAALLIATMSPLRVIAAPQAAGTRTVQSPQFTTTTRMVTLDVVATDNDGKPVEGLGPGDFAIFEDGVRQAISIFEFQKITDPTANSVPSYYILGYYSGNAQEDGSYRKLRVTANAGTIAKLDYRNGYYGGRIFARPGAAAISPSPAPAPVPAPDPNAPALIYAPQAQYSEQARKAKFQGSVILDVDVSPAGTVTDVTVNRGLGLGLDEKAEQAVRQWVFRPGTRNGQPVAAHTQVTVVFRLL